MQGCELWYDGLCLDGAIPGYRTLNVEGRGLFAPRLSTIDVPGRDGGIVLSQSFPTRELTVQFAMFARDHVDWVEQMRRLFETLYRDRDVEFSFGDEEGSRFGRLSEFSDPPMDSNRGVGKFTLFCASPWVLGREKVLAEGVVLETAHAYAVHWVRTELRLQSPKRELVLKNIRSGRRIVLHGDLQKGGTVTLSPQGVLWNGQPKPSLLDAFQSDYYDFAVSDGDALSAEGAAVSYVYRERWL